MKLLLFFVGLFLYATYDAKAKCISDIYSVGVSANSFNYGVQDQAGKSFDLGSNLGLGFKLGNLVYCPQKKLEIYGHYQFRYFSLSEAKKKTAFSQLQENVSLNSIGSDVRYLLNTRQELLIDVALKEDYAPVFVEPLEARILDDIFTNFKFLIGYRHVVASNKTEDFTLSGKWGVLYPLGSDAELGQMRELNLEYFRRISSNYSIRADLYFLQSSQQISKAQLDQKELGLRLNYLFRF